MCVAVVVCVGGGYVYIHECMDQRNQISLELKIQVVVSCLICGAGNISVLSSALNL